jgi:hypothetical protein
MYTYTNWSGEMKINDGGAIIFKESIRFPIIFFVLTTGWQLIANREVRWVENISICLIMVLIIFFYNWSKIPYKWKS